MRTPRTPTSGFTLIEVMAVMAIVGVVLIAIVPALDNMVPGYRMSATARKIASTMELAQSEAVAQRKEYAVAYDLDQHTYWLVLPQEPGVHSEESSADEGGSDLLGDDAPAAGGDQRPMDDLEHGAPPPDPDAPPTDDQIPDEFRDRDALSPSTLGEGVKLSVVVVGDEEHRSGTIYVPFTHQGDTGSHVVGLKLEERDDGAGEVWVEFNALTRTINYHEQRPQRRTLPAGGR